MNMNDLRVAVIGASGTVSSLLLEQINVLLALLVSAATLVYIVTKIVYLIKDHNK